MGEEELIAIEKFCAFHNVEITFISTLKENGLIDVITIDDDDFIKMDQLGLLEKIVRFHYDLEINLQGIETINYLLQRLETMQEEVISLKNRLSFYETIE